MDQASSSKELRDKLQAFQNNSEMETETTPPPTVIRKIWNYKLATNKSGGLTNFQNNSEMETETTPPPTVIRKNWNYKLVTNNSGGLTESQCNK